MEFLVSERLSTSVKIKNSLEYEAHGRTPIVVVFKSLFVSNRIQAINVPYLKCEYLVDSISKIAYGSNSIGLIDFEKYYLGNTE